MEETVDWLDSTVRKYSPSEVYWTYRGKRDTVDRRFLYIKHRRNEDGSIILTTCTKEKENEAKSWDDSEINYNLKEYSRVVIRDDELYDNAIIIYFIKSNGKDEEAYDLVFRKQSRDQVKRMVNALNHLIKLSGGKKEPF